MEDLLLSGDQHKVLLENLESLEAQHNVKICVPGCDKSFSCDVIFASVQGSIDGINAVKNFLSQKHDEQDIICEGELSRVDRILVVTLSDSDNETANVLTETQNRGVKLKKRRKRKHTIVDLTSSPIEKKDENGYEVSSTTNCSNSKKSRIWVPEAEFIPLNPVKRTENVQMPETPPSTDDDVVVEEIPVERPIVRDPSRLRPIVIDGSNVAREHGKKQNTFSCKGIQISVEYFLKRGHTQVTAFVPNFRRHCSFGRIPTTDQDILEELAKSQHVVFTPSRRLQGKTVASYDDRFIVDLATQTNGVILSNDNFKDLIDDNEKFKKTIEERLLMFCFVGDILMIPDDPLGRNGPKLEEFLSLPDKE